jgi:hypothetical protein
MRGTSCGIERWCAAALRRWVKRSPSPSSLSSSLSLSKLGGGEF